MQYMFFPPKDSIFFDQHQTHNKSADFFFRSIFPPKDLVYFSIKTNMKQYENVDFFL